MPHRRQAFGRTLGYYIIFCNQLQHSVFRQLFGNVVQQGRQRRFFLAYAIALCQPHGQLFHIARVLVAPLAQRALCKPRGLFPCNQWHRASL